jgi:hypothetical protein
MLEKNKVYQVSSDILKGRSYEVTQNTGVFMITLPLF